MGFVHVTHGKIVEELGVEHDPRGNISAQPKRGCILPAIQKKGTIVAWNRRPE